MSLRLRLVADVPLPPPRLSYELRDEAVGCSRAAVSTRGARLAGRRRRVARCASTSTRCRSPTAASSSARPAGGEDGHLYHRLAQAATFVVYPAGGERGAVLLEGRWSGGEVAARRRNEGVMSSRSCPDWPRLMEIAPDLQFKHYTVAEAKLPGDALGARAGGVARRRRRSAATWTGTSSTPSTPTRGRAGAPPDALVRPRRVVDERPGAASALRGPCEALLPGRPASRVAVVVFDADVLIAYLGRDDANHVEAVERMRHALEPRRGDSYRPPTTPRC